MIINGVPFYRNTLDNTHCFQAVLRSVLKYYFPNKKFTYKELDKLTGKKKGMWTWPIKTYLELSKLGLEVIRKSTFDYERFSKVGEKYLIEKYGKKMGEAQIKHSNVEHERKLAREFVEKIGNRLSLPSTLDLESLIDKGYLVVCNVNYYPLYGKSGYSGHFVHIFGYDKNNFYLHDPGLPPKKGVKVSKSKFSKAWEYPTKDSRNIAAFRLKV